MAVPWSRAPASTCSGRRRRWRRHPSGLLLLVLANSATFLSNLESLLRLEFVLESKLAPLPPDAGDGQGSASASHSLSSSWHLSGARPISALEAAPLPGQELTARRLSKAAVVIPAGGKIAEQDRIRQLVGSLHHWHPELPIVGRRGESRLAVAQYWKNVRVVAAAQVQRDICDAGSASGPLEFELQRKGLVPPWLALRACSNQSLELTSSSAPPLLLLHALLDHSSALLVGKGVVINGWIDHLIKSVNRDGFIAIEDDKGHCRPTLYGLSRGSPAVDKLLKPQILNALEYAVESAEGGGQDWKDWFGVRPRRSQGHRCLPQRSVQLSVESSETEGAKQRPSYFCRLQHKPLAHVVSEPPLVSMLVADHGVERDLVAVATVVDAKTTSLQEFHSLFWTALVSATREWHQQQVHLSVIVGVIGSSRASNAWTQESIKAVDWAGSLSAANVRWSQRLTIFGLPEGLDKAAAYNFLFEKAVGQKAAFFMAWDYGLQVLPSLRQRESFWLDSMRDALRHSPRFAFLGTATLKRGDSPSEPGHQLLFHMVHSATHLDIFKSYFPYDLASDAEVEWISAIYGAQNTLVVDARATVHRLPDKSPPNSRCGDVQVTAMPVFQHKYSARVEQWLANKAHGVGEPIWRKVTFVDVEKSAAPGA